MKTCEDSAPTGVEAVSSMMSSGSDESDSICCVVCWRFVGCVGLSSCDVWKGRLVFVGGCCSVDAVDFFGVVEVFVLEVDVVDVVDCCGWRSVVVVVVVVSGCCLFARHLSA